MPWRVTGTTKADIVLRALQIPATSVGERSGIVSAPPLRGERILNGSWMRRNSAKVVEHKPTLSEIVVSSRTNAGRNRSKFGRARIRSKRAHQSCSILGEIELKSAEITTRLIELLSAEFGQIQPHSGPFRLNVVRISEDTFRIHDGQSSRRCACWVCCQSRPESGWTWPRMRRIWTNIEICSREQRKQPRLQVWADFGPSVAACTCCPATAADHNARHRWCFLTPTYHSTLR